jgi:ketosteroid isomerase-like protein
MAAVGLKSRRGALRQFAGAAPIAATPAIAGASLPTNPDAELIAIERDIRHLNAAAEHIRNERIEPLQEEFERLLRTNLEACRVFCASSGRDAAMVEVDALTSAQDRLYEKMTATPATTQAGRAAKVRAFLVHAGGEEWRGPDGDLDWTESVARALLGELAGMSAEELAAV